eukprot:scaffold38077_cov18-Tisochrysis_lutea.AAC.4
MAVMFCCMGGSPLTARPQSSHTPCFSFAIFDTSGKDEVAFAHHSACRGIPTPPVHVLHGVHVPYPQRAVPLSCVAGAAAH